MFTKSLLDKFNQVMPLGSKVYKKKFFSETTRLRALIYGMLVASSCGPLIRMFELCP